MATSDDSTAGSEVAPLWAKGGLTDAAMLAYTARDDWRLDQALLAHDLRASKAHVRGLGRVGALREADAAALVGALEELEVELAEGRFILDDQVEDGHTAIELELVRRLGDVGKRVHLGRSRNDQVLVAMRLYERERLATLARLAATGGAAFLALARRSEHVVMPGYTHLQRAMPQSVAHWAAAYAEGFAESARALLDARKLGGGCPLGAAAGYGVPIPLDRDGVAEELGFDAPATNPLWSQTSRGLTEVVVVTAAWHAAAVLRRLAWDLSLFATSEFAFVRLPDAMTTGSSIMPNKRNPDVVELLRASCSITQGALAELQSLVALPSGYHRDLQLTKAPVMRALEEVRASLSMLPSLLEGLSFDERRLAEATTRDTLATDRAVELATSGMPFRDAYRLVAAEVGGRDEPAGEAARTSLERRVSLGASGRLALERLSARLDELFDEVSVAEGA